MHSVSLCETFYTTHAVFRSHGDYKRHGERDRQSFEKPLCTLCLRAELFVHPKLFLEES